MNGVDAFMCWDTGSELNTISPDFIRALGLQAKEKETPIRIRLGTKGSMSTSSYEVKAKLGFGNTTLEHSLDMVNLDRWDMILGADFCNEYDVVLNFKDRTIKFGNVVIKALSRDEEAAIRTGEPQIRQSRADTKAGKLPAKDITSEPHLAVLSRDA